MASPVTRSSFDPSGRLFAVVVAALDSHTVKIQSVQSRAEDAAAISTAFKLDKGSLVNSLAWVFRASGDSQKKRRKADSNAVSPVFSPADLLLAVGTNKGILHLFSPTLGRVVAKISLPSGASVRDCHFAFATRSLWICDASGALTNWDAASLQFISSHPLSLSEAHEEIQLVRTVRHAGSQHLLFASHSVYLAEFPGSGAASGAALIVKETFPCHVTPIHTLEPFEHNGVAYFVTAAANDRFINVFSVASRRPVAVLVCRADVLDVSVSSVSGSVRVCAVTEDGTCELFADVLAAPSEQPSGAGGAGSAARRRRAAGGVRAQKPSAFVGMQQTAVQDARSAAAEFAVKFVSAWLSDAELTVAWLENAAVAQFDHVSVAPEFPNGEITLQKRKVQKLGTDRNLYGDDVAAAKKYSEAQARVTAGDNLHDLENGDTEEAEKEEKEEAEGEEEEEDPVGETLADKLEYTHLKDDEKPQTARGAARKTGGPVGGSLSVVLSQALRTNDHALLETCLQTTDAEIIRTTIARLNPNLCVALLNRLAEKAARSQNRSGVLNVWIKWVLIIHGAYLVNVPNLAPSLASLHSVLTRRSDTLGRLLALKGKLELLNQQMVLKADILAGDDKYALLENGFLDEDEESDEDEVEYFEELDTEELNEASSATDLSDVEGDANGVNGEEDDGYVSVAESEEGDDEDVDMVGGDIVEEEDGFSDLEVDTAFDKSKAWGKYQEVSGKERNVDGELVDAEMENGAENGSNEESVHRLSRLKKALSKKNKAKLTK